MSFAIPASAAIHEHRSDIKWLDGVTRAAFAETTQKHSEFGPTWTLMPMTHETCPPEFVRRAG